MNDNLYSIIMKGAFANKAEFDDYVKQSTPEQIYKLVIDGAFSSFEEFKQMYFKDGQVDGNVEDVKKKTKVWNYLRKMVLWIRQRLKV